MKYTKRITIAVLIVILVIIAMQYQKLTIISGYAAKNMASTVFIAGRSAVSVNAQDHQVPMIKLAKTEVDLKDSSATSSVFGLMERKAIYRQGLGSVLVTDENQLANNPIQPKRNKTSIPVPYPFGHYATRDTLLAEVDYSALQNALNNAFSNPEEKRTRTVIIFYKNQLIGERYSEGFNRDTPVLGWSMTKSVLATLYGILQYQGKIDMNQETGWADWQDDSRKDITYNDLLRMQSGLEWDEDYSDISDVTKMLFLENDMGKIQAEKQALAPPGEIWNYSSGTSNLLSGMLRTHFSNHQEYLDFPYRELIDRIGMNSMILETDMNGHFVGSSYAWASTGDWAKFGLLYLNNGHWNEDRLFSEEWTDYVRRPTQDSDGSYGAHFWLNKNGKYPDVPTDMYSANGYQGQYVFIIPSKELVVVRTGLAEGPFFDVNGFLADILSALP